MIEYIKILEDIKDKSFCIVKLPYESEFVKGNDIDIFVTNSEDMVSNIIRKLEIPSGTQLKITKGKTYIHVDIIDNHEKIIFRYDLISELTGYQNISVKDGLLQSVIASSSLRPFIINGHEINLPAPSVYYESLVRYIEYHEYIATRPDKIKHQDYIIDAFRSKEDDKKRFFELFHYFVSLPVYKISKFDKIKRTTFNNISVLLYYPFLILKVLKKEGINGLIMKIKKRVNENN